MRNIKKLLSILMVLAMVLSLGVSALASTVTLPDDAKGHDMVAYQIFTGEQSVEQENADPSRQLGITGWGNDIAPTKLINALNNPPYSAGLAAGASAETVANFLQSWVGKNDQERAALANVIAGCLKEGATGKGFDENGKAELENGYWVIVDKTNPVPTGETRSTTLLDVIGKDLILQDKIDKPTVEKKIVTGEGFSDADVAGLGETVTFRLTTTLTERYADYESYYLAFHDKMDPGLDFQKVVSVTCGGTTIEAEDFETNGIVVNPSADGHSFDVILDDVKSTFPDAVAGNTITVTYTATVNDKAVVRNENDVYLNYSDNPADTTEHGETTHDTVVVFTLTVDGNKIDGEGKPLSGAGFVLLKETAAPAGEEPQEVSWDELGSKTKGTIVKYNGKYYEVWAAQVESGEDGGFKFERLGVGTYVLAETKVPEGYNRAEDRTFTVEEITEGGVVTGAQVKQDGATDIVIDNTNTGNEGLIDETVTNNTGLELPETGGIGTTIFYVVGAILVAGAVILLVTRKRMSGADK